MTTSSGLPRIAMFHGGGSTSKIFKVQCEALQKEFASNFEFVYFDAPFESGPGAGVLPFFVLEKWGPYLNWFSKGDDGEDIPDGTAGNYDDEEGIERVVRMMKEYRPGGKWVGCLGFSQGTRVVAGLLLWQQRRRKKGVEVGRGIDIQFGIMCMGAGAPMKSTVPESLLEWDRTDPRNLLSKKPELIEVRSLHMHGLKDVCYEQGKVQMKTYFDPKTVTQIEINYHHAMPWHAKDRQLLLDNIKKLAYSSG